MLSGAVAAGGHVAHADAVGPTGALGARERLSRLIGAGGRQGAGYRHLDRVREVSTGLNDIGENRHGEALLVLQLRQRLLVAVGGAHVLQDGQQTAQQEQRDGHGDHELDQGEAALPARLAPHRG